MGNPCASPTVIVGSDSWSPATYAVTDTKVATQVAQANANRRSVLIVCTSDSVGTCHVTDRQQASTSIGGRTYPLVQGEGVTINTSAEVWVLADVAGSTATVKVIEEFGSA